MCPIGSLRNVQTIERRLTKIWEISYFYLFRTSGAENWVNHTSYIFPFKIPLLGDFICLFILFYSNSHLPIPILILIVNHSNGSMCICLFVCIGMSLALTLSAGEDILVLSLHQARSWAPRVTFILTNLGMVTIILTWGKKAAGFI